MKLPVNSYNVFQEQGKMLSSNALGKMTTKRLINLLTIHNSEAVGELTVHSISNTEDKSQCWRLTKHPQISKHPSITHPRKGLLLY